MLATLTAGTGISITNGAGSITIAADGGVVLETLTGNTGGAISPIAGNINTVGTGSITIAGAGNTLTTQLTGLTNHNVLVGAGTATITNISPSTAGFVLTSNGLAADPSFQTISASGAITTITGNSGGAESPLAGNFNILGTGSITVAGSANTETVQLTGLTNHSLLVGAGTPTITSLGVATNGQLPIGSTGADPVLATLTAGTGISITNGAGSISIATSGTGTVNTLTGNTGGAISPTAGNINTVGTGSITIAGSGSTLTTQLTGLTNHSLLVGAGTATITNLGVATNGQLPIGSTGADPVLATLTAGTGISITNGAGSITIAATGSEQAWTDEGTSFNAVAGNGYFITAAGVTATLPASPSQGNLIMFTVDAATTNFTITANTGQVIRIGSAVSAAAGNAVNTARGDSVSLVYRSSDTAWIARSVIGTWVVT